MTKKIKVGNMFIGGDAPISVQSMCNIPFSRFEELKAQAISLEKAGCEIIRVAVPDTDSVKRFAELKKCLSVPLVADIHFDYRLAIGSIVAGADKIRINPGNIGSDHIRTVAREAENANVPIRVGINSGSLEKSILHKYGSPCADALAESAAVNVGILEECGFENTVVSIKSSDVKTVVTAYSLYNEKYNPNKYPLHIGVTEAGTVFGGTLKSAAGIGSLLLDGIGDTIRVSLTADPVEEVRVGKALLKALGIRKSGIEVISCPTCGRTTVNSVELANTVEREFSDVKKNVKIAVMGCVVNGIGEAANADFGVTGVKGEYILFRKGEILRKNISENEILGVIREQIEKL